MEDVEQSKHHAGGRQEALWRERPVRNPAAKVSILQDLHRVCSELLLS